MRHLWFKGKYVEPILAGEKCDTIRGSTWLKEGDVVPLSVGPRAPFATARVLKIEPASVASKTRIAEAAALCDLSDGAVRITFALE